MNAAWLANMEQRLRMIGAVIDDLRQREPADRLRRITTCQLQCKTRPAAACWTVQ
jgi:hypothetical protein